MDNLYALGFVVVWKHCWQIFQRPEIVSPDAGGAERARYFARRLRADLTIIDKRRERANHSEVMNVIGNVETKWPSLSMI